MDINYELNKLIKYGLKTKILYPEDKVYSINQLLNLLKLNDYEEVKVEDKIDFDETINNILEYALKKKLIDEDTITRRDLFDTQIMNSIIPRPSQIIEKFWEEYKKSPKQATKYYYSFSKSTNYIRESRIKKDIKWKTKTKYGTIDISINMSKPEKDPKDIAFAKQIKTAGYPKCVICKEAEGLSGTLNRQARENHRIIPIDLRGEKWFLQYSPYSYYNEHCIVLNSKHVPMKIDKTTFEKLFCFINMFPHYMIGSNAGLPVVGGSILTHEHYQGGRTVFPMDSAKYKYKTNKIGGVEFGILDWPMSVIRLRGKKQKNIIELADVILKKWKKYSNPHLSIFAKTDGEDHNTITPIARKKDNIYELDLVLRNNYSTKEYPLGVFHPHENLHHIKKENIGLIEVMGLAILPSRLKEEMKILSEYLLKNKDISKNEKIAKHYDWAEELKQKYHKFKKENIDEILKKEIGIVFQKVLEDAGVFKTDKEGQDAFIKFVNSIK